MPRRPAIVAVTVLTGLVLALAPVASAVPSSPASNKAPTPPKTGTWKFTDGQAVTSGSLIVFRSHGHLKIKDMHGVLNTFYAGYGCPAGAFTVDGQFTVRKTKVNKAQDEWAVSKGWGSHVAQGFKPLKVDVAYEGKTVHAALEVTFANKSYQAKRGTYSFSSSVSLTNLAENGCDIDFALQHK